MNQGGETRIAQIKDIYAYLFQSGRSSAKLKDAAIGGRLFSNNNGRIDVIGRSMAWKLFLIPPRGPLKKPASSPPEPPLDYLRESRQKYVDLWLQKVKAPDGSYDEGFIMPGSSTSPKRGVKFPGDLETNNPLSLHDENPWREWFSAVELKKTIRQDVERTFPDIAYFRNPHVQSRLTTILFVYCSANPDVGYRQGMHEILAPFYHAVDVDSIDEGGKAIIGEPALAELCSNTWVEADAWALFNLVMQSVSKWYEWREPPELPPAAHVDGRASNGQGTLLRAVDPTLWKCLDSVDIEPQIYGLRWLRLLFTREFGFGDSMTLWDGLFASEQIIELSQWVCVAMLIRIRNQLIPSDYSGQLAYLLHYPPPPQTESGYDTLPYTSLLLRQAMGLQISPIATTATAIMIENRNVLGIPFDVPEPPVPTRRREGHGVRSPSAIDGRELNRSASFIRPSVLQTPLGMPEMFARGLLERGESLGINKTLMSAVSEIRRNLPDISSSLVWTPGTGTDDSYPTFPLSDEGGYDEKSPSNSKLLSELRARDRLLGESLGWIVDALLQDEDENANQERASIVRNKKREALESLSYIRDVLVNDFTGLEEDRLWSEEEYLRKNRPGSFADSRSNQSQWVEIPRPAIKSVATGSSRSFPSNRQSIPGVVRSPPKHDSSSSSFPPFEGLLPTKSVGSALATSPRGGASSPSLAPSNYTRSSFMSPEIRPASIPRPPPLTSKVLNRAGSDQRPKRELQDPLGVL